MPRSIIGDWGSERLDGPAEAEAKRCTDPDGVCGANLDGPWHGRTNARFCPVCDGPLKTEPVKPAG